MKSNVSRRAAQVGKLKASQLECHLRLELIRAGGLLYYVRKNSF